MKSVRLKLCGLAGFAIAVSASAGCLKELARTMSPWQNAVYLDKSLAIGHEIYRSLQTRFGEPIEEADVPKWISNWKVHPADYFPALSANNRLGMLARLHYTLRRGVYYRQLIKTAPAGAWPVNYSAYAIRIPRGVPSPADSIEKFFAGFTRPPIARGEHTINKDLRVSAVPMWGGLGTLASATTQDSRFVAATSLAGAIGLVGLGVWVGHSGAEGVADQLKNFFLPARRDIYNFVNDVRTRYAYAEGRVYYLGYRSTFFDVELDMVYREASSDDDALLFVSRSELYPRGR